MENKTRTFKRETAMNSRIQTTDVGHIFFAKLSDRLKDDFVIEDAGFRADSGCFLYNNKEGDIREMSMHA